MTAALGNTAQGTPFATGVDAFVYPQFIGYAQRAPTTQDIYNPGTRWQDNSVNPPVQYYTVGAGLWYQTANTAFGVSSVTGTAGQISASPTTGNVILSIPNTFTAPGSITATTTLTATLGNITATNGNIVRGTAGNKDIYSSVASTTTAGSNSAGTVALVSGEAVVATTAVTANSQIRIYRQGVGSTGAAALGFLSILTRSAGVSFTIRAVDPADATAAQASDVSVVGWEIVN